MFEGTRYETVWYMTWAYIILTYINSYSFIPTLRDWVVYREMWNVFFNAIEKNQEKGEN